MGRFKRPSVRSGSDALRSPSWADATTGSRPTVNATQQMRARIPSLYTRGPWRVRFAEPALRTHRWIGARRPGSAKRTRQAYSTMVSCELENENGWKIVVRPNASFALTV